MRASLSGNNSGGTVALITFFLCGGGGVEKMASLLETGLTVRGLQPIRAKDGERFGVNDSK